MRSPRSGPLYIFRAKDKIGNSIHLYIKSAVDYFSDFHSPWRQNTLINDIVITLMVMTHWYDYMIIC